LTMRKPAIFNKSMAPVCLRTDFRFSPRNMILKGGPLAQACVKMCPKTALHVSDGAAFASLFTAPLTTRAGTIASLILQSSGSGATSTSPIGPHHMFPIAATTTPAPLICTTVPVSSPSMDVQPPEGLVLVRSLTVDPILTSSPIGSTSNSLARQCHRFCCGKST